MDDILHIETINFIKNEMCIEPEQYITRIVTYEKSIQKVFRGLGVYLTENDTDKNEWNDNYLCKVYALLDTHNITQGDLPNEYETADILIRSFARYKKWGLLELYCRAESDAWDPLPKISTSLYSHMDELNKEEFDKLPHELTIYRGTSYEEYKYCGYGSDSQYDGYGQSWTLDKQKAEYFAYELGEEKYEDTRRAVMKAKIDKKMFTPIYYQNKNVQLM